MEMTKFIIYGGGYRGKRLLSYLGQDRVLAFVDSDKSKVGTFINDVPVVNMNDYKTRYNGIHIIISPSDYEEIEQTLKKENIISYSRLSDLPSEFSGYGNASFDECYVDIIKKYDMPCYIRGNNAFSLLLAEKLIQAGNDIFFLNEVHKPHYGIIFITSGESIGKIEKVFPEIRIEDAFYHSSLLHKYRNDSIAKLKDKYKMLNRCFIVATGPSLSKQDVEKLKDNKEFCIGVNKIFLLDTEWIPDIYMVTDSVFMTEEKKRIRGYRAPLKLYGDSNVPPDIEGEIVHIVSDVSEEPPRFSDDVAQRIYGGGTVTYAALQIAVYLGIKKIYLLGVDCNYKRNSKVNHFYHVSNDDKINHQTDKMIRAFEVAQEYALQHGVNIYNATRGGKLEVFQRVDFDSLF